MIQYKCDYCEDIYSHKSRVELIGYSCPARLGLLLPDHLSRQDFCTRGCFIRYLAQWLPLGPDYLKVVGEMSDE